MHNNYENRIIYHVISKCHLISVLSFISINKETSSHCSIDKREVTKERNGKIVYKRVSAVKGLL